MTEHPESDSVVNWISVDMLMPLKVDKDLYRSETVLISDGRHVYVGYLQFDWLDENTFPPEWKLEGRDAYTVYSITHWAPLPGLPQSEEE